MNRSTTPTASVGRSSGPALLTGCRPEDRDLQRFVLRVVSAGSGSEMLSRITVLLTSRAVSTLFLCANCDPAAGVTRVNLVVECPSSRTPLLCRQLERLVQVTSVEVQQATHTDGAFDRAHCQPPPRAEPVCALPSPTPLGSE